ncbi:GAF domain-containing protein [Deinococcus petrolearius]|uniref:histidine kinase n=1 Tax=Deinococcus petrolearius TaxID=1751295 RepID=A0ABW1DMV4_9DEIO
MKVELTASSPPSPGLNWSPFAQQIVDDAQAVLNFPYILLARFDPVARTSQALVWSGRNMEILERATRLGQRLLAYDTAHSVLSVDGNPLLQAACDRGETIITSVEEITRGLVPPLVARIAAQVAGAAHCLVTPLQGEDRVLGTLSCYQRNPHFTDVQIRTAQAFARQVALSIHNAELLEAQRQTHVALEASRRLVAQAEERTRRDISEFLHSRVQSRLLVAEYRLGEIGDVSEEARARIEAVRAELEDLRERDVRQVSHQLHPEALRIGLVAALQVLASRMQGVLRVQIVADAELLDPGGQRGSPLPPEVRLVAFRTIEEALGNVLKHVHAEQATVVLSLHPEALWVEVNDDGQGFDVARRPPGLGLLCLGARVESAGGRWGIDSRPGGPTRLWAELPR